MPTIILTATPEIYSLLDQTFYTIKDFEPIGTLVYMAVTNIRTCKSALTGRNIDNETDIAYFINWFQSKDTETLKRQCPVIVSESTQFKSGDIARPHRFVKGKDGTIWAWFAPLPTMFSAVCLYNTSYADFYPFWYPVPTYGGKIDFTTAPTKLKGCEV